MPRFVSKMLRLPLIAIPLVLISVAAPAQTAAQAFTMQQVLGYPYPSDLVSSPRGDVIAWVMDQRGVRNIWVAFRSELPAEIADELRER